jgi:hypothetical protein
MEKSVFRPLAAYEHGQIGRIVAQCLAQQVDGWREKSRSSGGAF